ncbi:MAG: L-2-amino-thiazoline-4-carboxylic acid hydrolase [Desulfomonilaceae bacterium]
MMGADLSQIDILTRREIEARIIGPLITAFTDEIGQDRTLAIVRTVIESLALESGVQLAKRMGGNSIACFVKGFSAFRQGGAYEMEELELSETRYEFNITRCRYAEMYKELGMADLGFILSCSRDFELVSGFNAKMTLRRTKTIMEGYDHCDFRIAMG